jgi:tricorn protease
VRKLSLVLAFLLLPAAASAQGGETRLLRFPDICGDTIVFTYGGDLWLTGTGGGLARRLTSDRGEELFAKFSPDCKQVAFTGQYSGTRQVHVIGVEGGAPRQLTFRNDAGTLPLRAGIDNQVFGWTPDGKNILFKSHRTPWSERIGRPSMVPANGGMEKPLSIRETSTGTLSPDGTRYAFAPVMNEFRGWKRYYGGRASDVWIYDLRNDTAEQITKEPSIDDQPVWIGNTVYFVSNRDRTANLFAYDTGSKAVRKVTSHTDFDVFWPSGDDRRIVYENGGWIHLFDPATGRSNKVSVRVEGDLPHTLPYFKGVVEDIQAFGISPTGKRSVFGARGDVFTVPAEKGEIRNLTNSPGVREMDPTWSPDGRWVAYLSDRTGEYEIWVRPGDGSGEERRVTKDGTIWRFPPVWSPDSKKLAFGDQSWKVLWVDVESGKVTEVDRDEEGAITDYTWAPDSRWLAYTKVGASQMPSIWLYNLDDRKARQLTSDLTAEFSPVFEPNGRYIYFLSNRDFNLTFSGYEFAYVYTNPTRVYVGVLSKEGPALFLPQSDEEEAKKPETVGLRIADAQETPAPGNPPGNQGGDAADEAKGDSAKKTPVRVKVDFDGFEARVRAIPAASGNYQDLSANADAVFYRTGGNAGPPSTLKMFSLKDEKEQTILEGVQAYELSADGKKILYNQRDTYGIVDARPGAKPGDGKIALDNLELQIHPREEWRQMYVDAWRTMRDWFYDPAMHGTDWKAMRDRYAEMLPFMSTRSDLDYLLTELGGELSAGHVYVNPGNSPGPERVENGLLGAEVEPHSSGYYRVAHIYPGENWHANFRSPLTEPGVNVKVGHYILAVDGQPTNKVDNFYRLLQNKADRVVTLLVNTEPSAKGAWEERVRPVSNEQNLYYLDWVVKTREKVEKASNGRIGYIHLPNTAVEGNRELFKYFYPQANKEALILDDRYNGGGFIPDQMIQLLSRPHLNNWVVRNGSAYSTPGFVNTGPKVALINGQAGSGGDAFPYYFKKTGLGPLIGTTTWGGLIGLSGNPSLVDGGSLTTPSFRLLTTEGEWAIEAEGVKPDIEIVDRPDALARGEDPTLEAGIAYLLKELEKNPPKKLVVPPPPKGGAPR